MRALLRIPLYYQILIANAALVLVAPCRQQGDRGVRAAGAARSWFEVAGCWLIGVGVTLLVTR